MQFVEVIRCTFYKGKLVYDVITFNMFIDNFTHIASGNQEYNLYGLPSINVGISCLEL